MFDNVFLIIIFIFTFVWYSLQIKTLFDESRYWRRMTAMFIRPTLDKKDFGLPDDDED